MRNVAPMETMAIVLFPRVYGVMHTVHVQVSSRVTSQDRNTTPEKIKVAGTYTRKQRNITLFRAFDAPPRCGVAILFTKILAKMQLNRSFLMILKHSLQTIHSRSNVANKINDRLLQSSLVVFLRQPHVALSFCQQ